MSTTPEHYVTAEGKVLTTCGSHRRVGYYVAGHTPAGEPVWACNDCGSVPEQHETVEETAARRAAEVTA